MKRKIIYFVLIASLIACKEKKKSDPEPAVPSAPANSISVKIDGTSQFSCSNCVSTYYSGGLRGITFATSSTSDQILFLFSTAPKTGTFSLVKQGDPAIVYVKNFTYYHAIAGSISVTAADTSAKGTIKKYTGTFSCSTDTSSGLTPYALTEGSFNVDFK